MNATVRISYVEDEPDIRAVTELALRTLGSFDLDICVDGEEALRRIPEFAPDLVLLDVMMPGVSGPEVLKELRRNAAFGNTPVVFMTAKVQDKDIISYRELGAVDVIRKPFDPMTLPERLERCLDGNGAAE